MTTNTITEFQVVKLSFSYKVIVERPTLNSFWTTNSIYHLKIKFLTKVRISEVGGKQALAQKCYVKDLKTRGMDV